MKLSIYNIRKISFGLGLILFLPLSFYAQSVKFKWVTSTGGKTFEQGQAVTTDFNGNVYTTGIYQKTVDFDPDTSTYNLTSNGHYDIFVQKLDKNGLFCWAKSIGSYSYDNSHSITTDQSGNVYITGFYRDTVDFDPGLKKLNLVSNGMGDIFVLKLDSSGNLVWARSIGGASNDMAYSIVTDKWGNVYTTGFFDGTVDFDPGKGISQLKTNGANDIFVHKMDSRGHFIWAKSMGGSKHDVGNGIGIDTLGNIYIIGDFQDTADLDPGASVLRIPGKGYSDIFIQKLDTAGNLKWVKSFGGSLGDAGNAISVDPSGNLYVTGFYIDTIDFGSGSKLVSSSNREMYLARLDTAGQVIWAKSTKGIGSAIVMSNGITTDSTTIYVTGLYRGKADFDPGNNTLELASKGDYDMFIQSFNRGGDLNWAKSIGGWGYESGHGITTDGSGNIIITGPYSGSVDFDPGIEKENRINAGNRDIYVLKLKSCFPDTTLQKVTACDSFIWIDGITYKSSNYSAKHYLVNEDCCDSILFLKLTIHNSTKGEDRVEACDSFTWINGVTYKASIKNTVMDTLVNVAGCDSIVTLNLSLHHSATSNEKIEACDSFTWVNGVTYKASTKNTVMDTLFTTKGCDSILTLDLTVRSSSSSTDIVEACNSYKWIDGKTYKASTNAIDYILTNSEGCDSVVTLNLTIHQLDTGITRTDPVLISNEPDATYQWLNCMDNYSVISGETSKSFTASRNGTYAVEIKTNNCLDTSECIAVLKAGVNNRLSSGVSVFPNPSSGSVNINLGLLKEASLKVFNESGQLIYQKDHIMGSPFQFNLPNQKGRYVLELGAMGAKQYYTIVRK